MSNQSVESQLFGSQSVESQLFGSPIRQSVESQLFNGHNPAYEEEDIDNFDLYNEGPSRSSVSDIIPHMFESKADLSKVLMDIIPVFKELKSQAVAVVIINNLSN